MSIKVEIISGLGEKAPAAILIHAHGRRLLLDAGGPMQPDEPCDWYLGLGLAQGQDQSIDAILISHDHVDHIGSVRWLPDYIPLYCTAQVARSLPSGRLWHPLPTRGEIEIEGVRITCGQAGHSLGGLWLHLDLAGGIFYSGDFSTESLLYPFDQPPPADLALLDASYGTYDTDQTECRQALLERLTGPTLIPTLLPVPPSGRALELALWCQAQQIEWALDPVCEGFMQALLQLSPDLLLPGVQTQLSQLTPIPWHARESDHPRLIRLAANANGIGGESGRLIEDESYTGQVIYTGYTPAKARADIAAGRAKWLRWNVHPRLSDLQNLADDLSASQVIPLFCSMQQTERWKKAFGERFIYESALHL
ncbi:MBL fold metallo-hydrolase [Nitrincola sp. MINF-07-Sa-05]|uniref:MBL fold metallo-hydrolase n=1 Tax=Nitrincola salilacus TaxID=3400273 RepID=UPI003917C665